MRATNKALVSIALILFIAPLAAADPGFYIGGKIGTLEPDFSDVDLDDDNPVALQVGYDFGGISIQGEAYSSESEVDNSGVDADLDVIALYGVLRTSGFFYFMGKAGLVNGQVEGELGSVDIDQDDNSLSYGIGAGLNFTDLIFVEAEYVAYDIEDVDLDFFGVSANIKF